MIIYDKKRVASQVLGPERLASQEAHDNQATPLEVIATELVSALKSEDIPGAVAALKAFITECYEPKEG